MPAARFVSKLNEQIGYEFAASQQYIAVAVHYDDRALPRLAAFFYRQALEERNHAMMMIQYLLDADDDPQIPGIGAPIASFGDIVEPVAAGARAGAARRRPGRRRSRAIARDESDYASRAVHAVVHQGAGRGDRHRCPTCCESSSTRAESPLLRRGVPRPRVPSATAAATRSAPAAAGGAL